MPCKLLNLCEYETHKLVRIQSVRLGSLKWTFNGVILMFICIMMLWNKEYQEHDYVVSSVTAKVKGVALTSLPDVGAIVWDVVDYSGPSQGKNSFFVVTNVIVTKEQRQGKCPEVPPYGKVCQTDKDCAKGFWDQHSHGVQTGACVKFDVTRKTCEVSAWCPIETKKKPPKPALLASAENFTVLIKNNVRFPNFNFMRRNILPEMTESYLKRCQFNRHTDPSCPIFRLGDIVQEARENFSEMAVEGGVIGIQIKWDCNLDGFLRNCLPKYSFRRLDEKESNRTLYPGLNFRFARYQIEKGVEERTLFKAFGIRFDVMVFGKAGKFSIIQLIIFIGSTLSYYALTTVFIDWLIGTSCYSKEARQNYSEKKVESVQDRQQCILCVSFVDENHIRVVKRSHKKSLQQVKPISIHPCKDDTGHLSAMVGVLQKGNIVGKQPQVLPQPNRPAWCLCGCCLPSTHPQEQLCCRQSSGRCITTSSLFEQLVLSRPLLDIVLLYREPLSDLTEGEQRIAALRHCAYRQYISWRFGAPLRESIPVMPSCSLWRIREEYPSQDGEYTGLRPRRTTSHQSGPNTQL
ncbi:P2X purinoceptor 7 isoform X1 [Coregonus clupeaformis]|uniref:P2X purinoceptor 7 isoform X1 n=2 Tax=Coregonus clupeaformis TaxID=59861 RepID=UPI001BE11158|nr:P2X purinoceptor 7 isoform X1 [Coregonus clupeaformis]